jgi:uncharacterized protein YfaS (alpha-2-macroglobulin family)
MTGVSPPRAPRPTLILFLLALSALGVASRAMTSASPATPKKKAVADAPAARWKEVDRLVSEQKFAEAQERVDAILSAAERRGDGENWTRALVRRTQLEIGLHGYETAVRFLKEHKWPPGLLSRVTLELFYAQSLVTYFHGYSWEIQQRERVESTGAVDLKAWTGTQIYAEAVRAYLQVWREREALGREDVRRLSEFLEPNDYPSGVRGTLRDAVTYLFAAHLADTSGWTPAQSNEVFRLDLPALLRTEGRPPSEKLDDDSVHPIVRLATVLGDLEAWHASRGEREAAFEARLERLRRFFAAFTEEEDRSRVEKDLEERLPEVADVPWFAMGKAQLAEFIENERPETGGDLARARAIAEEGRRAYPDSLGGRRCLAIVKRIEAPDYRLDTMQSDGAQRRSILVNHKNVAKLQFRAFALDLPRRLEAARNPYGIFANGEELLKLIDTLPPAAQWSVTLPATPDYRSHASYVTPPMKDPGLYIVAASGAAAFGGAGFPLVAANLVVTDLVLVTRAITADANDSNALEVQALSGETGRPLSGVEASVYRAVWNPERIERVASVTTDAHGLALFPSPGERPQGGVFVFARKGKDLAFDQNVPFPYGERPPAKTTSSLLFTDRSIYRPLQKISWKVLGYRGDPRAGRFEVFPASPATVTLFDQNNQKVDSRTVTTNDFGSAAGEFVIPAGRALGTWRLTSSLGGGQAGIRVEEYKRPTFEVTWKDPSEPLRLNRPARLTGEARYYFGLPVATGSVRWRVTRTPQYFWWSYWSWMPTPSARMQTVASGVTRLKADGTFDVAFTPAADERLGKDSKELTYSYQVEADASDEGGETRSASRSFRLGFVSVEARVDAPPGFLLDSKPGRFRVVRTSLDGVPRAGKGSWSIARLEQPGQTLLPADQPPTIRTWAGLVRRPSSPRRGATADEYQTPGDALRPRWDTDYAPERMMRLWKDGAEISHGELSHNAKGEASVEVSGLPAGAYRLHYRTVDDFGEVFEMPVEFLIGGRKTPIALPVVLAVESTSVPVGGTARILVTSGLPEQTLFFDFYSAGRRIERRELSAGRSSALIEIPIEEKDRGGFAVKLSAMRDHQWMSLTQSVFVPWDDKELKVSFSTFRDKLRPAARETWKVKVEAPKGSKAEQAAAELLAYMYDRSLDAFVPHYPPNPISIYPIRTAADWSRPNIGESWFQQVREKFPDLPIYPLLRPDFLKFYSGYAIGGPGRRGFMAFSGNVVAEKSMSTEAVTVTAEAPMLLAAAAPAAAKAAAFQDALETKAAPAPPPAAALRSNFAETAFWQPYLLTGPDGTAAIEFTVPDSVTSWNVFVHAVTRDWKSGSVKKETKSVKDLMVRPYVPRFLREGDRAEVKIVVNNASEKAMSGRVTVDIVDADTNATALSLFGIDPGKASLPFTVVPGGGTNVTVRLSAPRRVGLYAFKVTAVSGDTSDGELRPVPLLPGRMHLVQSRFVTLHDHDRREMTFADLARNDDPTRVDEQMVVTVDAQLFYSVLQALPYLVNYPYECTEQTLNRFVSTGIVSSLFRDYPAVARMAEEMSKRDTRLETFDAADANRKMALEETPWLETAKGGRDTGLPLARVLDPRIAKAEREAALAKLSKAQTESGGFPWWPGGPPSSYMTLYILHGFANALEFGAEVPRDIVLKAWGYAGKDVRRELDECMHHSIGLCHFVTFVNYTLSSYPDEGWYKPAFDEAYRKTLLEYSFARWRLHPPNLKAQLALTLKRMGRPADAKLVWDSVMDSARTERDLGTYWAREDRSWLWYNDTIETHAFALRTLSELNPLDARRAGLVQWLFLNKKLNQWKSTRATAEVVYSLAHYLKQEGALAVREKVTATLGSQTTTFSFEPDHYTGAKNQVVVPGEKIDPKSSSTIVVEKEGKGLAFASATWHFSTETLPTDERGDFFSVSRKYFKRESTASGFALKPLAQGTAITAGDEVEVQISLRSKHAAEYVHLRDPRAAGLEPGIVISRYKWDLGISWYEETRDSGTNFFFEQLPAGEYTLRYRLRANMAGVFRVAPATVQSMYAPEFAAYSTGAVITVK